MSQIINKRIAELKKENYKIKPQNLVRFNNPYLLKSKTEVLNEIYNKNIPLDKKAKNEIISTTNLSDSFNVPHPQMPSEMPQSKPIKIEDDSTDESVKFRVPNSNNESLIFEFKPDDNTNINFENLELAQHVQNEVYKNIDERRPIEGFNRIKTLGNAENVVYKSDSRQSRNLVLWGIRGSTMDNYANDFVVDAQIGLKKHLSNPLTDWLIPESAMKERFKNTRIKYLKIRDKFPNAEIIMGGHSLGNAVGLDILNRYPDDKNLKLFGFNGYNHPIYSGLNDERYSTIRAEDDLVSLISDNHPNVIKVLKDPTERMNFIKKLIGTGIVGGFVNYFKNQYLNKKYADINAVLDNFHNEGQYESVEARFDKKFGNFDDFMRDMGDVYYAYKEEMTDLGGIPTSELNLDDPMEWLFNEETNVIYDAVKEVIKLEYDIAPLLTKRLLKGVGVASALILALYWLYQHSASKFKPISPRWKKLGSKITHEEPKKKKEKSEMYKYLTESNLKKSNKFYGKQNKIDFSDYKNDKKNLRSKSKDEL